MELDLTNNHIYWIEGRQHKFLNTPPAKIHRANLDGSGELTLVTDIGLNSYGLALDLANSHMYWIEATTNKIRCANLDGTGVQDHITGIGAGFPPQKGGIALQIAGSQGCGSSGSSQDEQIRYVPFKNKYVLMALMALLGGWLVVRARRGMNENSDC